MAEYDFERAKKEWSRPAFPGRGYFPTRELIQKPHDVIRKLMNNCIKAREQAQNYCRGGENLWIKTLRCHEEVGTVLDFGCGSGVESLMLARAGNDVILADISEYNVKFALHVMRIFDLSDRVAGREILKGEYPFFESTDFDAFHAIGSLHATPYLPDILKQVSEVAPDCEVRMMVASEKAWLETVGELTAIDEDVSEHPMFAKYVRSMDTVGQYNDWYNREKLEYKVGEFMEITDIQYIGLKDQILLVRMQPKCR